MLLHHLLNNPRGLGPGAREEKHTQGGDLEVKITVSPAIPGEWGPQENIDFPHTPPARCL